MDYLHIHIQQSRLFQPDKQIHQWSIGNSHTADLQLECRAVWRLQHVCYIDNIVKPFTDRYLRPEYRKDGNRVQ